VIVDRFTGWLCDPSARILHDLDEPGAAEGLSYPVVSAIGDARLSPLAHPCKEIAVRR